MCSQTKPMPSRPCTRDSVCRASMIVGSYPLSVSEGKVLLLRTGSWEGHAGYELSYAGCKNTIADFTIRTRRRSGTATLRVGAGIAPNPESLAVDASSATRGTAAYQLTEVGRIADDRNRRRLWVKRRLRRRAPPPAPQPP